MLGILSLKFRRQTDVLILLKALQDQNSPAYFKSTRYRKPYINNRIKEGDGSQGRDNMFEKIPLATYTRNDIELQRQAALSNATNVFLNLST